MQTSIRYSYHDYLQLPKDKRNESHQRILVTLTSILLNHVRKNKLGAVYCASFDVLFSEEDIVQPDIIFVSNGNKRIITKANIKGTPDLIIEVLSPSTSKRDIGIKKKLYARHGVREYWVVDPERETVEVFLLRGKEFEGKRPGVKDYMSSTVINGLNIEVKEIFV